MADQGFGTMELIPAADGNPEETALDDDPDNESPALSDPRWAAARAWTLASRQGAHRGLPRGGSGGVEHHALLRLPDPRLRVDRERQREGRAELLLEVDHAGNAVPELCVQGL